MRKYPATLIALLSLAGCGKSDENDSSKKAEAIAKPFAGTLTVEILDSAKDLVKPFDLWKTGFAKLQAKLGKPTSVVGNEYFWAVLDGKDKDSCRYLYVSKDNEAEFFKDKKDPQDMIGTVSNPGNTSGTTCSKALGLKAEDLEDPNAPVPNADGTTTIEDFRAGLAAAPSKWVGQKLTLSGVFFSVSTRSVKGSDVATVSVRDSMTKINGIRCVLTDAAAAEGIPNGTAITVTGMGNAKTRGTLTECSLLKNAE